MSAYFTVEACTALAFDKESRRDPDNDQWCTADLGWLPDDLAMKQAQGRFPKAFQLTVYKHDTEPENPMDRFKPIWPIP